MSTLAAVVVDAFVVTLAETPVSVFTPLTSAAASLRSAPSTLLTRVPTFTFVSASFASAVATLTSPPLTLVSLLKSLTFSSTSLASVEAAVSSPMSLVDSFLKLSLEDDTFSLTCLLILAITLGLTCLRSRCVSMNSSSTSMYRSLAPATACSTLMSPSEEQTTATSCTSCT